MKLLKIVKAGAIVYAGIGIGIDLLSAIELIRDFERCKQINIEYGVTFADVAFGAILMPILWPLSIEKKHSEHS